MRRSVLLNVRLDEELKQEAVRVLESLGLSAADAVRMLFTRIVRDQAFPLELKVISSQRRAAMREGEEPLPSPHEFAAEIEAMARKAIEARALRPPASSP